MSRSLRVRALADEPPPDPVAAPEGDVDRDNGSDNEEDVDSEQEDSTYEPPQLSDAAQEEEEDEQQDSQLQDEAIAERETAVYETGESQSQADTVQEDEDEPQDVSPIPFVNIQSCLAYWQGRAAYWEGRGRYWLRRDMLAKLRTRLPLQAVEVEQAQQTEEPAPEGLPAAPEDGIDMLDDNEVQEAIEGYLRSSHYRTTQNAKYSTVGAHVALMAGLPFTADFDTAWKQRIREQFQIVWTNLRDQIKVVPGEQVAGAEPLTGQEEELQHDDGEKQREERDAAPCRHAMLRKLDAAPNWVLVDHLNNSHITANNIGLLKLDANRMFRMHTLAYLWENGIKLDTPMIFGCQLLLKGQIGVKTFFVGARVDIPDLTASQKAVFPHHSTQTIEDDEGEVDELYALHVVKNKEGVWSGWDASSKKWRIVKFKPQTLLGYCLDCPEAEFIAALDEYGKNGPDFVMFHQSTLISKELFSPHLNLLFQDHLVHDARHMLEQEVKAQTLLPVLYCAFTVWERIGKQMGDDNQALKHDGLFTKIEEAQWSLTRKYQGYCNLIQIAHCIPQPSVPVAARQRHGGKKKQGVGDDVQHTGFTPTGQHQPKRLHTTSSDSDAATGISDAAHSRQSSRRRSLHLSDSSASEHENSPSWLEPSAAHRQQLQQVKSEMAIYKAAKEKLARSNEKYRTDLKNETAKVDRAKDAAEKLRAEKKTMQAAITGAKAAEKAAIGATRKSEREAAAAKMDKLKSEHAATTKSSTEELAELQKQLKEQAQAMQLLQAQLAAFQASVPGVATTGSVLPTVAANPNYNACAFATYQAAPPMQQMHAMHAANMQPMQPMQQAVQPQPMHAQPMQPQPMQPQPPPPPCQQPVYPGHSYGGQPQHHVNQPTHPGVWPGHPASHPGYPPQ